METTAPPPSPPPLLLLLLTLLSAELGDRETLLLLLLLLAGPLPLPRVFHPPAHRLVRGDPIIMRGDRPACRDESFCLISIHGGV